VAKALHIREGGTQVMRQPVDHLGIPTLLGLSCKNISTDLPSEAGFRQMKASSLKGKHAQALLDRWQVEGLSSGTIKNRLSHLRWWAEKIGKAGILPADNTQLGVAERRYVTNISKAQELSTGLEQVTDAHVRMSLQLQAAFGLRREEAIKFQPSYADRGDHIALKGSWTKGGGCELCPSPRQSNATRSTQHTAWRAQDH
jgi:hypothetical protein